MGCHYLTIKKKKKESHLQKHGMDLENIIISEVSQTSKSEHIVRNTGLDEAQARIKIAGRNTNNLRYADDMTLMAESKSETEVAQLCMTLCETMDCSLSGSSVHGILQTGILEWVVISFSRGSSQPRN